MIQLKVLSGSCVLELRFTAERLVKAVKLAEGDRLSFVDESARGCGERFSGRDMCEQWCQEFEKLLSSRDY